MLLQNPDDLLFRITALLHRQLPRSDYERTPGQTGRVFRGQVNLMEVCPSVSDLSSIARVPLRC